jgi:MFS family permease
MKANTLKLCLPVIAITVQNNTSWLILSPFLQNLHFPMAMIGTLIALSPVLSLVSRVPTGMVYKQNRARMLITAAIAIMGVCSFLYSVAKTALTFALVHGMNGFAYGAATTLYMAFYVDSLSPDENRSHAMGYYVGSLAVGYSTGNFLAGYVADRFGYDVAFYVAASLSLVGLALIGLIGGTPRPMAKQKSARRARVEFRDSLKAVFEPNMAEVVIVAVCLNFLNQVGGVFLPLYGLAIGLTLTQLGLIRAIYTLCNAVTRPLSGFIVTRFGHRRLSYGGVSLQSILMMLVPLCTGFGSVLAVSTSTGFMRAVAVVSNAVGLVEDVDETRVQRGVASGIYNAAGDLGNILGPGAGGLIASLTGVAGLFVVAPLGSIVLFFAAIRGLNGGRWRA